MSASVGRATDAQPFGAMFRPDEGREDMAGPRGRNGSIGALRAQPVRARSCSRTSAGVR